MNITLLDTLPEEVDPIAVASPEASFYHTRPWLESLAVTSGLELRCLVAREGGGIRGFLPFFFGRTGPFRRAWSLPYGTYGGPATAGDEEAFDGLLATYAALLERPRVIETGWVDFRNRRPGARGLKSVTHVVDLAGGFDAVWSERFASDRRKRARRASRLGVVVETSQAADDLEAHYRIYARRVRAFGTQAPFPLELFQELKSRGGENVRLFVARHDGEVVGGHFNFYHGSEVIAWYGMTSERGDELQAGTLLYAECIRDACERGLSTYNLGGSLARQSLIDYKVSLGGEAYQYATRIERSALGTLGARIKHLGRPR